VKNVRQTILKVFIPILVFAFFLALGLFSKHVLELVEAETVTEARRNFWYAVQIGIWVSGAFCLVRLVNVFFWDRLVSRSLGQPVPRLLKEFFALFIFSVALAGIVGVVFDQSVTAILATSSVFGVVLGLALRPIILDAFMGLAINLDRSYRIGDWVEVHTVNFKTPIFGRVAQINWRTTHIVQRNKTEVILPNSSMGVLPVTNYSMPDHVARFETSISLDFSVPPERALRILLAGVKAAIGKRGPVEEPAPSVLLGEATEVGIRYRLRWYQQVDQISPGMCRHTVMQSVLEHLHKAGLTPAYHKHDIFHAPMPERNLNIIEQRGLIALLSQVDLFEKSLTSDEVKELARSLRMHFFKAGETLIRQGESADSMFILAEGLASVSIEDDKGEHVKISQMVPGEIFGEMSLLTGEPRSATVVAQTDMVTFEISRATMQTILAGRPEAVHLISTVMAERKLRSSRALTSHSEEEHATRKQNLHSQLLDKIKHFFGSVFGQPNKT
jgi:small-conductance mechanosensitive channel/CRP-like cAMP-binding protein